MGYFWDIGDIGDIGERGRGGEDRGRDWKFFYVSIDYFGDDGNIWVGFRDFLSFGE